MFQKAKYEKIDGEKSLISDTKNFLTEVKHFSNKIYEQSEKIILLRHFPTIENDGRFLGQKNDPSVLTNYEITNDLHDIKNKRIRHLLITIKKRLWKLPNF